MKILTRAASINSVRRRVPKPTGTELMLWAHHLAKLQDVRFSYIEVDGILHARLEFETLTDEAANVLMNRYIELSAWEYR